MNRLRRCAVSLLLSAALLPLAGCGSATKLANAAKAQMNLQESLRQAQLGQTAEAKTWADRAVAQDPNALETYVATDTMAGDTLTIQRVFHAAGDDQTQIAYMKQAAQKFPNAYQPLQALAFVQGRQGDLAGQKATATQLVALLQKKNVTPGASASAALVNALAQAYIDSGNFAQGFQEYQTAIRVYPSDWMAYNSLAYAVAVANNTPNLPLAEQYAQQALTLAKKAASTTDEDPAILDTLGWVQYRRGNTKQALDNLLKAVGGDPREPELRYHLGMIYLAQGNTTAAQIEFRYAVQICPGYAEAQAALDKLKTAPQKA